MELSPAFFGDTPVVYLSPPEQFLKYGAPCAILDNAAVARLAFRELMSSHPRTVAYVGGRRNLIWSREREAEFKNVAAAAGIPCFVFEWRRESEVARIRRMHEFAQSLPDRCGVFCATDYTASDFSAFLIESGRRIPQEVSVIGVDGMVRLREGEIPAVSTVACDFERMGFVAARMIGERNSAGRAMVEPLLVLRRESTRGRGRRMPDVSAALDTLRREACNGLSASDLAARFPGSRRLFEMRFREAMGHSVLDEIIHVRMESVFALLVRPEVPISSIADFTGFTSYLALHKIFRARYGMTMSEWRRRNAK